MEITLLKLSRLLGLIGLAFSTFAMAADQPSAANADWRQLPLITEKQVDKAWSQLGWGAFVVEDGTLRTAPDERGMGVLVYTKEKLGNCRIRIVYRTKDARSNSGIYIRMDDEILKRLDDKAPAVKRDENGKLSKAEIQKLMDASEQEKGAWWPVHHGYEVQICDTGDAMQRTGAIYSLAKGRRAAQSRGKCLADDDRHAEPGTRHGRSRRQEGLAVRSNGQRSAHDAQVDGAQARAEAPARRLHRPAGARSRQHRLVQGNQRTAPELGPALNEVHAKKAMCSRLLPSVCTFRTGPFCC
jgi:hypothetical protein